MARSEVEVEEGEEEEDRNASDRVVRVDGELDVREKASAHSYRR